MTAALVGRSLTKALFAAQSAHERRKVSGIIRSIVREMKFYRLNSRARLTPAAANLLVGMKFIVQI